MNRSTPWSQHRPKTGVHSPIEAEAVYHVVHQARKPLREPPLRLFDRASSARNVVG